MRWESNYNNALVKQKPVWSASVGSDYYTGSIQNDTHLKHYGIPGMKWGVITKEYIKKGYDSVRRKVQASNQISRQESLNGYRRGVNVGNKILTNFRDQEVQRPDLLERATHKVLSKFGMERYSKQASDMIKKYADSHVEDVLQNKRVQSAMQTGANAIAKGTGWLLKEVVNVSPYVERGTKAVIGVASKGGKELAKATGKAASAGAKWLANGGAKMIGTNIKIASKFIAKNLNVGSENLGLFVKTGTKVLHKLLKRRAF